jgi:hypothetical protein
MTSSPKSKQRTAAITGAIPFGQTNFGVQAPSGGGGRLPVLHALSGEWGLASEVGDQDAGEPVGQALHRVDAAGVICSWSSYWSGPVRRQMDEMSGSTMAARISVPTAAADDRRRTAAPCDFSRTALREAA